MFSLCFCLLNMMMSIYHSVSTGQINCRVHKTQLKDNMQIESLLSIKDFCKEKLDGFGRT